MPSTRCAACGIAVLVENRFCAHCGANLGLLGRGGMGEVYRAHDLKLEQQVALKFLPEAAP